MDRTDEAMPHSPLVRRQRIYGGIEELVQRGTLERRHSDAAERFALDYELAVFNARKPGGGEHVVVDTSSTNYDGYSQGLLDAMDRSRAATSAIVDRHGRFGAELLVLTAVERLSVRAVTEIYAGEVQRSGLGIFLRGVLQTLLEHYDSSETRKRAAALRVARRCPDVQAA